VLRFIEAHAAYSKGLDLWQAIAVDATSWSKLLHSQPLRAFKSEIDHLLDLYHRCVVPLVSTSQDQQSERIAVPAAVLCIVVILLNQTPNLIVKRRLMLAFMSSIPLAFVPVLAHSLLFPQPFGIDWMQNIIYTTCLLSEITTCILIGFSKWLFVSSV
jgi:hypothetical protein